MSSIIQADIYKAYMGLSPKCIPHWEHWSNPDAETYLTGINYYEHPMLCRQRMHKLYPELRLPIPPTDTPIKQNTEDDVKNHTVRWGDGQTETFERGEKNFITTDDVLKYSPLEHQDMSRWKHVSMNWNYTDETTIEDQLALSFPRPWGQAVPGSPEHGFFYNTMFMWPLQTFGWELFLECCLLPEFERIMNEFAEINRKVFRVMARLPVNFIVCHDDIVTTRGPVCSPTWMHKYIYPRYEEFWSILKDAGKVVLFMADGCMDQCADNVLACGARGIISEPYTDYKAIARKHKNPFLAGEGDNRILTRNDPTEIEAMVSSMVETSRLSGGYMMCIGNHIPWNVPGEAIKRYLDLSREWAIRS